MYIKPCKLVLILSIHENQDRLNQKLKPKHETCVCCELEHTTLSNRYNRFKLTILKQTEVFL